MLIVNKSAREASLYMSFRGCCSLILKQIQVCFCPACIALHRTVVLKVTVKSLKHSDCVCVCVCVCVCACVCACVCGVCVRACV